MTERDVAAIVCGVFGLLVGSFLNVAVTRVPEDRSVVAPRSRCPRCGAALRARDLVPLLSFLWLRGRCRYCQAPIGWRYPAVEAVTALLFAAVGKRYGLSADAAFFCAFMALLVAASAVDLERQIIPNEFIAAGLAAGVILWLWARPFPFTWALGGLGAGGGILLLIALLRPGAMGGGDVKLAAAMGWYMGTAGVLVALFCGFVAGAVAGVLLIATGRKRRRDVIPFGPFLAFGSVVALFFGAPLVRWWLGAG